MQSPWNTKNILIKQQPKNTFDYANPQWKSLKASELN